MTKILKVILYFGLISIGIDLIKKLIFTKFEMTRIFNLDFFIYEIMLEFGFLIITSYATHFIIKYSSKDHLGISLVKALIFAIIYGIICFISSSIFYLLIGAGIGFHFNFYDSFVKFIPNGFTQGILFMFVMFQLNSKEIIFNDKMQVRK